MLSHSTIMGRIEEEEIQLAYIGPEELRSFHHEMRNPIRWDAWFDITAELLGADWRDLDADYWRAHFDRDCSPHDAIRLFLEETA